MSVPMCQVQDAEADAQTRPIGMHVAKTDDQSSLAAGRRQGQAPARGFPGSRTVRRAARNRRPRTPRHRRADPRRHRASRRTGTSCRRQRRGSAASRLRRKSLRQAIWRAPKRSDAGRAVPTRTALARPPRPIARGARRTMGPGERFPSSTRATSAHPTRPFRRRAAIGPTIGVLPAETPLSARAERNAGSCAPTGRSDLGTAPIDARAGGGLCSYTHRSSRPPRIPGRQSRRNPR